MTPFQQLWSTTMMLIPTPDSISSVTTNIDIFCAWGNNQRVGREVGLYKPSMLLRFKHCKCSIFRDRSIIQPRRNLHHRNIFGAIENKLSYNLLEPSCAGFCPSCDDNIIIAKLKFVPPRGIHMVILKFCSFRCHRRQLIVHIVVRRLFKVQQ